jgi:putative two-component system response regulator
LHEDVYVPFDLNNPVEAELFRKLSPLITADSFSLGEWTSHCWRLAILTTYTALALGRPFEQAVDYGVAAYLHDLGKIAPTLAPIFQKTGCLSPEEKGVADLHGYIGAEMARKIFREKYNSRKVRLIMCGQLTHHLKYSGDWLNEAAAALLYNETKPKYLVGSEIPRVGRIVNVADSFDTMVSKRHYPKVIRTYMDACKELQRGSGEIYDPKIVDVFRREVMPQYIEKRRAIEKTALKQIKVI